MNLYKNLTLGQVLQEVMTQKNYSLHETAIFYYGLIKQIE